MPWFLVRAYNLVGVSAVFSVWMRVLPLLMWKTVLGEQCSCYSDWRHSLSSLQSRSLAAGFIGTSINFLLGASELKVSVSKHLSAPKMGGMDFPLMEWDTERGGLLH